MADLLGLFDGTFNAGGAGSSPVQDASPTIVDPENELLARLASGTDGVVPLVDYSDFSNFVTFNSANSLITITADAIINRYPDGGSVSDIQQFRDGLDGYQNFFLDGWPSWSGHLRLNPGTSSSFITVADFGIDDTGTARSSFLSPGTGSISFQAWIDVPTLTGSNDAMVLIQKIGSNGIDGLTVYFSGSQVRFFITSGSSTVDIAGNVPTAPAFVSLVCDRSAQSGTVSLYVATTGTYPILSASAALPFFGKFDLGSGSFSIASGSLAGKNVIPFTGSIDSLSVWSIPQTLTSLTSSFNRKVYAQPGLTAIWRFNDSSVFTPSSYASVARDSSGHRLDGRIQRFFSGSRGTGSLITDVPDPILSLGDPNVYTYIVNAQTSGTEYDRGNPSMFVNLFPSAFSDAPGGEVFQNFALAIARHFDRIKVMIDQMVNFYRVRFGSFDQAPDALLEDLGSFLGWQLDASFADADVLRYFLGRSVISGPNGNVGLDKKLDQIKVQFWRRALRDVMYLHKSRGTPESVNALLNIYGINSSFIRLKEYARRTETRPILERVVAEKSVFALKFVSGSSVSVLQETLPSPFPSASFVTSSDPLTVELRARFPLIGDALLPPSELSGAMFTLRDGNVPDQSTMISLWYEKPSVTSLTGNVYLTSSAGRLQLVSASVFDDNFYNFSIVRERSTGSITLSINRCFDGDLIYATSSVAFSGTVGYPFDSKYSAFELGSSAITGSKGQFWGQEARVWRAALSSEELQAHSFHFESYGRDVQFANRDLALHWRLNDGVAADGAGKIYVVDSTLQRLVGTGSNYTANQSPFTKFLEDYSYIPSLDYGWNQKKIRLFSGSSVNDLVAYQDERFVSLEFSMYDALNEDISHLMTSYDELSNLIGLPMNRYREDYECLQQMRETYFKRLQGQLSFKTFVDMLDFFDSSFIGIVQRLLPARALFKGDELVVESHMLERPKYQYQLRPVHEGIIDISGSIIVTDLWGSNFR